METHCHNVAIISDTIETVSTATKKGFAMSKGYQPKTDNLARFYKWGMTKRRKVQKKYQLEKGKVFFKVSFGLRTIYIKHHNRWNFAG